MIIPDKMLFAQEGSNVSFTLLICLLTHIFTIEINMCQPDPCRNGAQCTNRRTDFYCTCPVGFNGKTCDISKLKFFDFLWTLLVSL